MTRKEKEECIQRSNRVVGNRDISIQEIYRSQHYTCSQRIANTITSTGLLTVFKLMPLSVNLPYFVARWDEKNQTIDIDIKGKGVSKTEKDLFKKGKGGYSGHWSVKVPSTATTFTYYVCIQTRRGRFLKQQ